MGTALLDMMVESGLLNSEQYEEAMRNCLLSGGIMSTSLLEIGLADEDDLARFLSRRLGIPFFDPLLLTDISSETLKLVSPEVAVKYRILPLNHDRKCLSLAMADPSDKTAVDDLTSLVGATIRPLAAPEIRLLQALKKYYDCAFSARDQRLLDRNGNREELPLTVPAEGVGAEEELEEVEILEDFEEEEDQSALRLSEVAYALSEVRDRQEVTAILLSHLQEEFEVLALFLVRDHEVSGWKAICRGAEVKGFDLLSVPLSRPSVLKSVVEGKSHHIGPVGESPLNKQMHQSLGTGGGESALLLPLLLESRVINIVYVEGCPELLKGRFAHLQRVQEMASLAFRILNLKSKLLRF